MTTTRTLSLILLSILFLACDQSTYLVEESMPVNILPTPKQISQSEQVLVLSETSSILASDPSLLPLAQLFSDELQSLQGFQLKASLMSGQSSDIIFKLDPSLNASQYEIAIEQEVILRGGSYQALVMAKSSLLQLAGTHAEALAFPVLQIQDKTETNYRGLMLDLARQWHTIETIKKTIDLAAFYKINYLQLHFTDYQSYTLPSRHYPLLSTPDRHYRFAELKDLEAYSQLRGVTIIPEIDVPGHSSPFVKSYPDIFALEDSARNPYIINMGREAIYPALDSLIGEVLSIFQATPYLHIGGDEAYLEGVIDDPEVQNYIQTHALEQDAHEVYRHFLIRMNEIVKRYGKQMCVWEGFGPEGKVEIPKDIIVFEFESNRYLPNQLVEDGYTVVNTSWKPLYVVNQKKWSPQTIYKWNLYRWENWWSKAPSFEPIQVEATPLIVGAQMCVWEQKGALAIPSLRRRLPAMAERIWNVEQKLSYDDFMRRLEQTDEKLSLLIADDRQDSLLVGYDFVEPQ